MEYSTLSRHSQNVLNGRWTGHFFQPFAPTSDPLTPAFQIILALIIYIFNDPPTHLSFSIHFPINFSLFYPPHHQQILSPHLFTAHLYQRSALHCRVIYKFPRQTPDWLIQSSTRTIFQHYHEATTQSRLQLLSFAATFRLIHQSL